MPNAKRILIVEDNRVLSDVLSFNLERAGYHVLVAPNGAEAIDILRTETFDLLITDFQMPLMNGGELCAAVRGQLRLDLPILMCSAKGLELDSNVLHAELGVTRLLHKPFSMRDIVEICGKTLADADATVIAS